MTTLTESRVDARATSLAPTRSPRRARATVVIVCGLALLIAALLLSVMLGAVYISLRDVLAALLGEEVATSTSAIVWNLRLPRALVGGLVGLNLAVAGALLQAVMRNALAAPNTIGVTAGAGLAATFILVLIPGWPSYLPACAFVGALAATVLVYGISWMPGVGTSPVRMVLAGIAVTSILGAVTTFIMLMYNDRVGSVILWQSGSLNARSWQHLSILWPYSLVGLVGAVLLIRSLNVLQLGDEVAAGLGLRVEIVRMLAVIVASILAGSAVSVAGMVGFVGLMVPHIVRMLSGSNHSWTIPTAAVFGAALIVSGDLLARTIIAPVELPVGIITAAVGGPYFIYLLYKVKVL